MKRLLPMLAASALVGAASAQSVVYSNIPATGTSGLVGSYGGSAIPAYPNGTFLAEDDYALQTDAPTLVSSLRWVGGSSVAGTSFLFRFLDSDRDLVGDFQYTPSTGSGLRTLTGIGALGLVIPARGTVQVGFANPSTAAIYVFGSTNANTLGSSDPTVGTFSAFTPARNMAFEITGSPQAVPEPSALAALGLGALAVLRRPNKKA